MVHILERTNGEGTEGAEKEKERREKKKKRNPSDITSTC